MLCSKCQKEARQGKVEKGVFTCGTCNAAAKKSETERQIKERHTSIAKMLDRAKQMIYTAENDLLALQDYMKEKGIK